jgi:1-acyl-sn-glycerol-3-phosphate acyltransferase
MRKLGGIPIDRRAPQSLVKQIAERFESCDDLVLAVPPEGTRGKVDSWKSGFYHIASRSGVPIGLGYLDYARKLCGLGMFVIPSGNIKEDMNRIREFYRSIRGKYPHLESEPRLREEI